MTVSSEQKEITPGISTISESMQNLVAVYSKKRYLKKYLETDKRLIISIVILVLLFLVFFIAFLVVQQNYNRLLEEEVCTSSECIESSMMLLETIDLTQNPCEDFYQYSCGNFGKEHPVVESYMHNSWFLEKETRLNRHIQNVLESPIYQKDIKSVYQTKKFYRACLNRTELDVLGLNPLYKLLEMLKLPRTVPESEHGSSFNLGKTLALAQRYLSQDILITLTLTKGAATASGESSKNGTIIKISPGLILRTIFDSTKPDTDILSFKNEDMAYKNPHENDPDVNKRRRQVNSSKIVIATVRFVAEMIQLIVQDLDDRHNIPNNYNGTHLINLAYKILTFSTQLTQESDSEVVNKTSGNREEYMTFASLQTILDEAGGNMEPSNRIDWKEYLTTLFEEVNKTIDVDSEIVAVQGIEYFKQLSKYLGESKPESIERHVWWQIVENFGKYTNSDMRLAYVKYYQAVYGEAVQNTRAQSCTGIMKKMMNIALSHEMAKYDNLSTSITKVKEMLKDINTVFQSLIESLVWMDDETKANTLDKAQSVTNEVGYPDWLLDPHKVDEYYHGLQLKDSEFLLNIVRVKQWEVRKFLEDVDKMELNSTGISHINPLQVNAYYSRGENAIAIPAGILQTPFYFKGLESLNYGAIGTILGHELTHGFDIDGKNYNKFGERQDNLWPEEVTKEYENRAKCFVNQYEKYKIFKNKTLNGSLTLAENIADNGGVRESYKAYERYVSRNGREPKLPGFKNFSHEQLLFLSFANMWCETSSPRYKQLVQGDTHSPHRIRVLAVLQNMEEFANAFNCPAGSFMNPSKKCIIW